jgi:hypothetical protein
VSCLCFVVMIFEIDEVQQSFLFPTYRLAVVYFYYMRWITDSRFQILESVGKVAKP